MDFFIPMVQDDTQEQLQQQKAELEQLLSDPEVLNDAGRVKKYSVAHARIEKEMLRRLRLGDVERRLKETQSMEEAAEDEEMRRMAREEITRLLKDREKIGKENDDTGEEGAPGVLMEIRAGAGGDEASLFAKELFQMYSNFAKAREWKTTLMSESRNDLKGYKEVIFEITGKGVYETLRYESGVQRVQRIPETEKTGRIHTSTVSVAVLPKAKKTDLEIRPQDIKIEFFRSSGAGGQNVNKVETAVRIYHLPSGVTVTSQESRSQQQNRERAMEVLRARLLDAKLQEEEKKMAADRKGQIGTGDRSEKIRTYNFPQDRVTDHRIKESWHNLPSIMEGNLDEIVEALAKKE